MRTKERNPVVVAIIHTYAKDRELGSYLKSLVDAFISVGIDLHLIKTNDLVDNLGANCLAQDISEDKLISYIKDVEPDFVFTTNHGGVTGRLMQASPCPILTWMVDRVPFLHHGGDHGNLFSSRDYVVTSSWKNVATLENIYPVLKDRVYYLPFATRIEDFEKYKDIEQDIEISFVGTYFYCGQLTAILDTYKHDAKLVRPILELIERLWKNYDLDIHEHVESLGLNYVLRDFDLDIFKFKGLLANAISLNQRVKALDAVSDLGLRLHGTDNWVNVNQYSLKLLDCFQFGEFIKTRDQLVSLYQRTKIGLNISHHQAVDGLPYRVFDIMASRALLITNYRQNSDIYKLFGHNACIPMYRDEHDLRKLVLHYKVNENERLATVNECNRLIRTGFSFEDRVRNFYEILGIPLRAADKGLLRAVPRSIFITEKSLAINKIKIRNRSSKSGNNKFINFGKVIINNLSPHQRLVCKRFVAAVFPRRLIEVVKNKMRN